MTREDITGVVGGSCFLISIASLISLIIIGYTMPSEHRYPILLYADIGLIGGFFSGMGIMIIDRILNRGRHCTVARKINND
jgi:hypothetical protein